MPQSCAGKVLGAELGPLGPHTGMVVVRGGGGFGGGSADDLSTRGKISQPHLQPQICQEPGDPLTGCERCQSAWIAFGRELDNCFESCFFLLPSEWKKKYIKWEFFG